MTDHFISDKELYLYILLIALIVLFFPWSLIPLFIYYIYVSIREKKNDRERRQREEEEERIRKEKFEKDKREIQKFANAIPFDVIIYKIISFFNFDQEVYNYGWYKQKNLAKIYYGYFGSDEKRIVYKVFSTYQISSYTKNYKFPMRVDKFHFYEVYSDDKLKKITGELARRQCSVKEMEVPSISEDSFEALGNLQRIKGLNILSVSIFSVQPIVFSKYLSKFQNLEKLKIEFCVNNRGDFKDKTVRADELLFLPNLVRLHLIDYNSKDSFVL